MLKSNQTIMKELIKIQAELKSPKNQNNAFGKYKYRSCEDILEAVKPLLNNHNALLTVSDEIKELNSILFVEATARITVGEETVVVKAQAGIDPNRKGMDISQSFGSSSSYARKYALNGLFLIDDTKDADSTNTHGMKMNDTQIKEAKKFIANGGDINKVKAKYNVTSELEKQLTDD